MDIKYQLPKLLYSYNELEPYIDQQTMEVHHNKHHNGYTIGTNEILSKLQETFDINIILCEIFKNKNEFDKQDFSKLLLMGGGYINHIYYFNILAPYNIAKNTLTNKFIDILSDKYINLENFKNIFATKALSVIGSGWVWLCLINEDMEICYSSETNTITDELIISNRIDKLKNRTLSIITTKNQEHPQMYEKNIFPILAMDIWEHAYYLKYQNDKKTYIYNFFEVVNWNVVYEIYEQALEKKSVHINYDGKFYYK